MRLDVVDFATVADEFLRSESHEAFELANKTIDLRCHCMHFGGAGIDEIENLGVQVVDLTVQVADLALKGSDVGVKSSDVSLRFSLAL